MEIKELDKVIDFINDRWGKDFKCPYCNTEEFTITNSVYQLPAFNNIDTKITERDNTVFPVIPITCKNCGYTIFINAISCKILESDNDEK